MAGEQVSALKLTLHGQLVGYVAGYANNCMVLSLAPSFVADANRPAPPYCRGNHHVSVRANLVGGALAAIFQHR